MLRALNTAATGMASQESNVSTISNNIANVNTVGFKQSRTEFEDLLYETIAEPGSQTASNTQRNVGIQVGSGSKVSATRRIHKQGSPQITNNPFDVMIQGEGMFGILDSNNELKFTRNGAFNVDATGTIVNKSGQKLFPTITVPANTTSVNISQAGVVEAFQQGQTTPTQIGTIPLFTFTNVVGLKNAGGNLYRATASSGEPIQQIPGQNNSGTLMQGALETSNVNIMNEMTNLIKAQRAYESNSKVMNVADQMLNTTNQVIR